MKVDGKLNVWGTAEVVAEAGRHEKAGYDGLWAARPSTTRSCRCCSPPSHRTVEVGRPSPSPSPARR